MSSEGGNRNKTAAQLKNLRRRDATKVEGQGGGVVEMKDFTGGVENEVNSQIEIERENSHGRERKAPIQGENVK